MYADVREFLLHLEHLPKIFVETAGLRLVQWIDQEKSSLCLEVQQIYSAKIRTKVRLMR